MSIPTGAGTLLRQLEARSVGLGIVSNTGGMTCAQLAAHLPPDFDGTLLDQELVVLSSEVGVDKPDPEIFRKPVTNAGVSAELCLYCSDDLLEALAAQSVGMCAARMMGCLKLAYILSWQRSLHIAARSLRPRPKRRRIAAR